MSILRRGLAVLVLLAVVAGCSSGSDSLRDWASDEYTGSNGRYTSPLPPTAVAAAFRGFRRPTDTYTTDGRTFLQYPDDIVALVPNGGGTNIEIDGSRTGRRRHFLFIGNRWGRYQSYTDASRGGGSGSGK